jgi:hypothetical protein
VQDPTDSAVAQGMWIGSEVKGRVLDDRWFGRNDGIADGEVCPKECWRSTYSLLQSLSLDS